MVCLSLLLFLQVLPTCKTSGNPQFQRSDSEVERRQEYLDMLRKALSPEACSILPEMIVNCLNNDPSKRPTVVKIMAALGKGNIVSRIHLRTCTVRFTVLCVCVCVCVYYKSTFLAIYRTVDEFCVFQH